MKKHLLIPLFSALIATSAFAGDAAIGKQKAGACVVCHGNENFGGIFYTLQLAGRDADKLTVKSMKYKTVKILHPMMNISTLFYTEKELEDVAAYYQSLGKPFLTGPNIKIQGDEAVTAAAPAEANVAYASK